MFGELTVAGSGSVQAPQRSVARERCARPDYARGLAGVAQPAENWQCFGGKQDIAVFTKTHPSWGTLHPRSLVCHPWATSGSTPGSMAVERQPIARADRKGRSQGLHFARSPRCRGWKTGRRAAAHGRRLDRSVLRVVSRHPRSDHARWSPIGPVRGPCNQSHAAKSKPEGEKPSRNPASDWASCIIRARAVSH